MMHHCLACIQASSKLLQKCAGSLEGRESDAQRAIQSVSIAFLNNIVVILKTGMLYLVFTIPAGTQMCVLTFGNRNLMHLVTQYLIYCTIIKTIYSFSHTVSKLLN